jgi:single-stranded-DNA-specific exonuclease
LLHPDQTNSPYRVSYNAGMTDSIMLDPALNKPKPLVVKRPRSSEQLEQLASLGVPAWLGRVIAGRLDSSQDYSNDQLEAIVNPSLRHLPPPTLLKDSQPAAARIAKAVVDGELIGVLTDYDVDGITSHAVIVNALTHWFGCQPTQLRSYIGHRLKDGYGVSQGLVDKILADSPKPSLVITADCGSSDEARIALLQQAGIDVVVTDHHAIPEQGIPTSALAVVNPTQSDCNYPDKAIAGVMVSFLLLCVVRQQLIEMDVLAPDSEKLTRLLEFCSLGTVADAVSLQSPVNRAVVNAGLREINRLQRPCWRALVELLDHDNPCIEVDDLGYQIGPRINARSRMSDPHAARRFLLAESHPDAVKELKLLDSDNQDRKVVEREMVISARRLAAVQDAGQQVLVVFHPSFYAGVQGIVASRLVDWFGKPAVVLSPSSVEGQLSGSARSVDGIDIRQAMVEAAEQVPVIRFGGHKAAAGLTLEESQLSAFSKALNAAVNTQLGEARLQPKIETDGELDSSLVNLQTWQELEALQPFGRGWPRPSFQGAVEVLTAKAVGVDPIHLSLSLSLSGKRVRAIWFNALAVAGAPYPVDEGDVANVVYELQRNEFRGNVSLQLQLLHADRTG